MSKRESTVRVRMVLVDEGVFHHEEIEILSASLDDHDRLIDCLREDPAVLKRVHVDVARLCAAYRIDV